MGDGLTFAEQPCRSGPRLELGDAYGIDCEHISQKFSHEGLGATTRHVHSTWNALCVGAIVSDRL